MGSRSGVQVGRRARWSVDHFRQCPSTTFRPAADQMYPHQNTNLENRSNPSGPSTGPSTEKVRPELGSRWSGRWSTTFRLGRPVVGPEGFDRFSRFVFRWGYTWSAAEVKVVVGPKWSSGTLKVVVGPKWSSGTFTSAADQTY
jgi:hypothetical protein